MEKPMMIYGCRVIENASMVIQRGFDKVERSWRERLFTRPWRPWVATRWVPHYDPDPNLYAIPVHLLNQFMGQPPDMSPNKPSLLEAVASGVPVEQVFVAHPETIKALKNGLKAKYGEPPPRSDKIYIPGASGRG